MSTQEYCQRITPESRWFDLGLGEFWGRRALLLALVKRDLQVRYKNTVLGIIWVILQPVLSTLIFTLVLSRIFNSSGDPNYMLYTLIGFTFWQFFSSSIGAASGSVYEQASMIRKVYFPRAYIPMTIVLRQLFDFGVGTVFLLIVMLAKGVWPTGISMLAYVLGTVNLLLLASGLALATSGLSVLFRDVRHLIPFVVQIWFYLTPIFYNRQMLTGKLQFLAVINPVTATLDLVRGGLFDGTINWGNWLIFLIVGIIVALGGLGFFRKLETEIIDRA